MPFCSPPPPGGGGTPIPLFSPNPSQLGLAHCEFVLFYRVDGEKPVERHISCQLHLALTIQPPPSSPLLGLPYPPCLPQVMPGVRRLLFADEARVSEGAWMRYRYQFGEPVVARN